VQPTIAWIQNVAESLGGPGIFVTAFLDSSFLSLPLINDVLVVMMVTRHPAWMPYYATMATLGSIAGCYVLYRVAGKGSEAFLQRRLGEGKVERALRLYRKHGLLALMVPALLPPPAPFKLFVLAAGVARVRPSSFVAAIAVARGLRYLVLGALAATYGEAARDVMGTHGRVAALWLVALIMVAVACRWLWTRFRGATA
jgi:membrane protein YqaA with SNARE-associated domain